MTGRNSRAFVGFLLLAGAGAAVAVAAPQGWVEKFGVVTNLAGSAASLLSALKGPGSAGAPPSMSVQPQLLDRLAEESRKKWLDDRLRRKVRDPADLPVRWQLADQDLTDTLENIAGSARTAIAPLTFHFGEVQQIARAYQDVPSGRLVILGSAGAGKSVLASCLLLEMLQRKQPGDSVPVMVSLGSWQPSVHRLQEWLSTQIIRDYPNLRCRPWEVQAMVAERQILPILDGFDELEQVQRPYALRRLNFDTELPLVLTSRPEPYAATVAVWGVVAKAAVIELGTLTAETASQQLRYAWPGWTTTAEAVDQDRERAAASELSTPLMVSLARVEAFDSPTIAPAEPIDRDHLRERHSMQDRLMAGYVDVLYRQPSSSGRWGADQAKAWLAYLARHLERSGTTDLAWWELRNTVPAAVRILALGLATGLATGLAGAIVFEHPVGLLVGLILGLPVGIGAGIDEAPSPLRTRYGIPGQRPTAWRALVQGSLLFTFVGILLYLLIANEPLTVSELSSLLLLGFAVGVVWAVGLPMIRGTQRLLEPEDISSAAASVRADRLSTLHQTIVLGLTAGLLGGGLKLWDSGFGPDVVRWNLGGFVLGAALGLLLAFQRAWLQWLVLVRLWLPLTGRLPWRLPAFLADACERGVLRQAGAAYQFRHEGLQKLLAQPLGPVDETKDRAGEA